MKLKTALDAYVLARDNFEEAEGAFLHALRPVLFALRVDPHTAQVHVMRDFVNIKYQYNAQGGEWKDGWYAIPRAIFDDPLPQCAALEWKKKHEEEQWERTVANNRSAYKLLGDWFDKHGVKREPEV